jgi:nucleoside-diphosphate-sugar epimerase
MSELHVIFGTGPMGTSIAKLLLEKGKQVRMINRSGKQPIGLPPVEVCAGDAYDSTFTRAMTQGASVVYQCAQPAYHEWVEKFPPLQAAIVAGVTSNRAKLIVVENLYMYGNVAGKIHEGLPYTAHTRKGKVRAQMAQTLLDAHAAGKLKVAMARGSDFFGPGEPLSIDMTYKPALAGKSVTGFGSLDQPHSWTYVPDFARAMVIMGEREDALGRAWHVPTAPAVTQRQLLTWVFEAAGQPAKLGSMGKMMMRIGGLFNKSAGEMVEMMYEFEQPFVVDSSAFERTFNVQPTPLKQAVFETMAWVKANPTFGHG